MKGAALLLACAAVVAAAPGCGVRTNPRPPEDTAARAPEGFRAEVSGTAVELRWRRPDKTVDGDRLYDLAAFVVERRVIATGEFREIASIAVTDNDRIRVQKTYRYRDEAPPAGEVIYRVRAVAEDGQHGVATEPAIVELAEPAGQAGP